MMRRDFVQMNGAYYLIKVLLEVLALVAILKRRAAELIS
jgi:hypothetical protein